MRSTNFPNVCQRIPSCRIPSILRADGIFIAVVCWIFICFHFNSKSFHMFQAPNSVWSSFAHMLVALAYLLTAANAAGSVIWLFLSAGTLACACVDVWLTACRTAHMLAEGCAACLRSRSDLRA